MGAATSVSKPGTVSERRPFRTVAPILVSRQDSGARYHVHPVVFALALMGALLPTELAMYVGGARFTPGRTGIFLLIIPAITVALRARRHFLLSDSFAIATAAWMILATLQTGGLETLSSAGAEAAEFLGSYLVARAFIGGREALDKFIQMLKIIVIIIVILGAVDRLTGYYVAHDLAATAAQVPPLAPSFREDSLRAIASFDHPILFGTFCCLAGAIFLYSERGVKRLLYFGICAIGTILAISSAAVMGLVLSIMIFSYDKIMGAWVWRWKVLVGCTSMLVISVFFISNNPIGWFIGHLTLDPETGYYRVMIWDLATAQISLSPITGFSFSTFNNEVLDGTVDCVYLVYALRFGVPMIVLLLLTNFATFIFPGQNRLSHSNSYVDNMRVAFTLVLVLFMLIGLTVHFWNFMWIFWGMCIGIRASIRDWSLSVN
jgi:hypothetical protein